ncbi:MAG: STAS domain-containing protein [Planctomycetaceae bacterium]
MTMLCDAQPTGTEPMQPYRMELWTFADLDVTIVMLPDGEYGSTEQAKLEQLRDQLGEFAVRMRTHRLVLDLSEVCYYGAGFLGVVAETNQLLKRMGKQLIICGDRLKLIGAGTGSRVAASYETVQAAFPLLASSA